MSKWLKETDKKSNNTFKSHLRNRMKKVEDHIVLNYGTGNVEGLMARDKLCFSDD